jgi:hypothetical protein
MNNFYCLQVLASQTKIYIILEFVKGGELFDKIVKLQTGLITPLLGFFNLLGLEV